jgi:hypothetical protein
MNNGNGESIEKTTLQTKEYEYLANNGIGKVLFRQAVDNVRQYASTKCAVQLASIAGS